VSAVAEVREAVSALMPPSTARVGLNATLLRLPRNARVVNNAHALHGHERLTETVNTSKPV